MIYKLTTKKSTNNDNKDIILIRKQFENLYSYGVVPIAIMHNRSVHVSKNILLLCQSQGGKNLNDYFIESNSVYKDPNLILTEINIIPGNYMPRIFRPLIKSKHSNILEMYYEKSSLNIGNRNFIFDKYGNNLSRIISSVQQLGTLVKRLETIFNHVHPSEENYKVYGNEIRNLLIIACTEVEAQLKGVLMANKIKSLNKEYKTKDYVRLIEPLRLKAYTITFAFYPEISISPFSNWDSEKPTSSLDWYDAFNKTKHDRITNFEKATLINCMKAISAICVLLLAQYGWNIPNWKDLIGNYFELANGPSWNLEDCYLPPDAPNDWKEIELNL